MKTVIALVAALGGLGVLANFTSFALTNSVVTAIDIFVMLLLPLVVIVGGPILAKRATNIELTANGIFAFSYLVIALNTVHKGSPIGTAAYFLLALGVSYSLLFGWRGFLIAGVWSFAHFTLFLGLGEQLAWSNSLVTRHAHVIDMEAITGTISNFTLVYLIAGSCAAAFNGQIVRAVADLADARRKADEANAAKSLLLANTGHEIRTPMNGVLGMAQVLKEERLNPKQLEMVDAILESGATLTTLLNDLLDFSKIQAGKLSVAYGSHDLAGAVRSVVRLFEPKAAEKDLRLSIQVAETFPAEICCDPVRVRQCVANLVSNAIKFTPRGDIVVCVESERSRESAADLITISVRDTGIGMDDEVLTRLFGEFEQADAHVARDYGGTGLGLSIARSLARLMGGDLTVESRVGEGSTFTLTFIAPEAGSVLAAVSQPPSAAGVAPRSARRILLVDDNLQNRRVVRSLLAALECEVGEAENGQHALEMLALDSYDVVLMDLRMPVMDGEEAFRRIRGADQPWRDLPVIALTADTSGEIRKRCIGLGMSGFVPKPIDARDLISQLRWVLGDGEVPATH